MTELWRVLHLVEEEVRPAAGRDPVEHPQHAR